LVSMRHSIHKEIQSECMEHAFHRIVPESSVRAVFMCLLYDMQVTLGMSHGTSISERYVHSVSEAWELNEICSEVLAIVLTACPKTRYELIELINRYKVLKKQHIHNSSLKELMHRVEILNYCFAMNKYLRDNYDPGERAICCMEISLPRSSNANSHRMGFCIFSAAKGPRRMVLTNKRLMIMEPPRQSVGSKPCGMCGADTFCPISPSPERIIDFHDVTRIVVSTDQQMFILGTLERSLISTDITGEQFDIVIAHKSDTRRRFLETLSILSGPNIYDRIDLSAGLLMYQSVKMRTSSEIVCITYATNEETDDRLSLFVLSMSDFCEFEVCLEHWIVPPIMIPWSGDGSSLQPADFGAECTMISTLVDRHKMQRELYTKSESANEKNKTHAADTPWEGKSRGDLRRVFSEREKAKSKTFDEKYGAEQSKDDTHDIKKLMEADKLKEAKKEILKLLSRKPLSQLKQVEFESKDVPLLRLTFQKLHDPKTFRVRFLDDTARERWRRGLALALHGQSDHAVHWNRGWNAAGGRGK